MIGSCGHQVVDTQTAVYVKSLDEDGRNIVAYVLLCDACIAKNQDIILKGQELEDFLDAQ